MKFEDLIKLLNDRRVDYIVIGAQACAAHGYVRATNDLDLLIRPETKNIEKIRAVLEAFGFDTQDASLEDFQTKKILFRQYWLDVDIHPHAKGVETEQALANKIPGLFENVPTHYASLDDLIRMKKAAGRPQDIEDLRYLEEIKRQISRK